jgi:hypothetical protein
MVLDSWTMHKEAEDQAKQVLFNQSRLVEWLSSQRHLEIVQQQTQLKQDLGL